MERLLRYVFNIGTVHFQHHNDVARSDRLIRKYTVTGLLFVTALLLSVQYVGEPIRCWCPAQFTDSHRVYTNSMCWISNTFYIPFNYELPFSKSFRIAAKFSNVTTEIGYYQWSPYILLTQAIMCYFPSLIWSYLCKKSNFWLLHYRTMIECTPSKLLSPYKVSAEQRRNVLLIVAQQIYKHALVDKQSKTKLNCTTFNLTVSYLAVKSLLLCSVIIQLLGLNYFLSDTRPFGLVVIEKLWLKNSNWSANSRFPRVTMCDFEIRHFMESHRYIVQCVLSINLFNEKIFLFLWFWLLFVAIVLIFGMLRFVFECTAYGKARFIRKLSHVNKDKFSRFLTTDSVTVVKILRDSRGAHTTGDVLRCLYHIISHQHDQ